MNNFYENKYFSADELKCKRTGVIQLATGFLSKLIALRELYNKPMTVNSCCRSREYNYELKLSATTSYHIYDRQGIDIIDGTCAVDIAVANGVERANLARLGLENGWCVGVHRSFIHLDCRTLYLGGPVVLFPY